MNERKNISRRTFITRASKGAALMMGVALTGCGPIRRKIAGLINAADTPYVGNTDDPMIWFEILADNQVILYSPKVEMGQGIFTGFAQMAADELEIDIERIKVAHAETDSGNVDKFATGGSTSTSSLWEPLRELAATMRETLKSSAADLWGTEVEQVSIENGVALFENKRLSYGEIVQRTEKWNIADTPDLKNLKDYKYIGKPIPRIDLMDKVIGAPIFGMDASLPDMLYGSILRPSKIDAQLLTADVSEASNMPGVVKIVQEDDFIGVVATSYMAAERAKDQIKAEWKTNKTWQTEDIEELLQVGQGSGVSVQRMGNIKKLEESEEVIVSEFRSPIGAHAQLEPNGCLADVKANGATIIMSTQVVDITRSEVADRLGLNEKKVNVKPTFLGGGFGRRLHTPNAMQAAVLSKAVGRPVKCFFTRKEEFQHDTFRPPTHHKLQAILNEEGYIDTISHELASGDVMFGSPLVPKIGAKMLGSDVGAWRGGMIQYEAIPHVDVTSWRVKLPFATSWWRSLGLLANSFAIESFMDELAAKTQKDPIAFRLAHIADDERGNRLKAVIETAAERANWTTEVKNGRAMGFAVSTDANTPCAQVVEVSVANGRIKVHKVTCVIDPGVAVNPDQIRAQCEGSIIMGISAALYEKMYVDNNELRPVIYGPYQMALMRDAPKQIDVVILENASKPGAVGEPPLGPVGASIANALFRLTGKRAYAMPFGQEDWSYLN